MHAAVRPLVVKLIAAIALVSSCGGAFAQAPPAAAVASAQSVRGAAGTLEFAADVEVGAPQHETMETGERSAVTLTYRDGDKPYRASIRESCLRETQFKTDRQIEILMSGLMVHQGLRLTSESKWVTLGGHRAYRMDGVQHDGVAVSVWLLSLDGYFASLRYDRLGALADRKILPSIERMRIDCGVHAKVQASPEK